MQLCEIHDHDEPKPCISCCYTDNGYCTCDCHNARLSRK